MSLQWRLGGLVGCTCTPRAVCALPCPGRLSQRPRGPGAGKKEYFGSSSNGIFTLSGQKPGPPPSDNVPASKRGSLGVPYEG